MVLDRKIGTYLKEPSGIGTSRGLSWKSEIRVAELARGLFTLSYAASRLGDGKKGY